MSGAQHQAAPIRALVVDYGGVLTNPLAETFGSFCARTGLAPEALGAAMAKAEALAGRSAMARLEVGEIDEDEFLESLLVHLPAGSRERLGGKTFGELWFAGRRCNEEMVDVVRAARAHGLRTALLTNNTVAWRPLWRAQLRPDELFDVVVDSSEEGVRKPDPAIYRILIERLGIEPEHCLFVDDVAENCSAAEVLGLQSLRYEGESTLGTVRALLEGQSVAPGSAA